VQLSRGHAAPATAKEKANATLENSYLITSSFIVTRMVGFAVWARWLFKGSPEI